MNTRNGTPAVLIAALACAVPAAATAAPTNVTVRIEGKTKTIFEGKVATDVHDVDGSDGSGAHKCDGTNGGSGTVPGPTSTGALDDAVKLAGLTWKGSYDASFQDFIVNQIGPDAATSSQFWGVASQGKSLEVGGCQHVVSSGEEVLWAYDLFSKKHLLRATGGPKVRAGRIYTVKVSDTQNGGVPIAGARVGGKKTNSKGIATLRFKTPGTKRLKATRADSLRSNQLTVKVLKRR
ncbi:MAG: hypothetical protein QOF55_2136 [Thermoleophilaceae bacterium]|jgi:hypothetical protein|nr:hypothetical protein [Thermoleophilaceae bacterium]MEA2457112.1 hypothetical protein [Thermoleophilaceae bacterium]